MISVSKAGSYLLNGTGSTVIRCCTRVRGGSVATAATKTEPSMNSKRDNGNGIRWE